MPANARTLIRHWHLGEAAISSKQQLEAAARSSIRLSKRAVEAFARVAKTHSRHEERVLCLATQNIALRPIQLCAATQ